MFNTISHRVGMDLWLTIQPHAVAPGFAPRSSHTKDHHKNGTKLPAWYASIRVGWRLAVQFEFVKGQEVCGVWGHSL